MHPDFCEIKLNINLLYLSEQLQLRRLSEEVGYESEIGCGEGPVIFARLALALEVELSAEHGASLGPVHAPVIGTVAGEDLFSLLDRTHGPHHLSVQVEHPCCVRVARVVDQRHCRVKTSADHFSRPLKFKAGDLKQKIIRKLEIFSGPLFNILNVPNTKKI